MLAVPEHVRSRWVRLTTAYVTILHSTLLLEPGAYSGHFIVPLRVFVGFSQRFQPDSRFSFWMIGKLIRLLTEQRTPFKSSMDISLYNCIITIFLKKKLFIGGNNKQLNRLRQRR